MINWYETISSVVQYSGAAAVERYERAVFGVAIIGSGSASTSHSCARNLARSRP